MSLSSDPHAVPSLREHKEELAAALATRRVLGPELEEEVVQQFLQRIERAVEARAEEVSRTIARRQRSRAATVAASIGLSVPLVGITDDTTGPVGVALVCLMVVVVNLIDVARDFVKR